MTMMETLYNRFDDLLNPIIVKELRQVVRGKFFWGVLLLFLAFQCAVLSLSIADRGMSSRSIGGETLAFLFGILFFASFVLIPIQNGFKFSTERNDGSDELLFITTITPETIIKGKFYAAMVFILLLFSAFAPFMAMTFFLSGVDMPLTFLTLFFALLISAAGAMGQICFAALAHDAQSNKAFRAIGGMAQMMAFFAISGTGAEMVQYGPGRFMGSSHAGLLIVSVILFCLAAVSFFYRAAASIIAPAGANRMLPVRKCGLFIWLGSLILSLLWAIQENSGKFLVSWAALICVGLVLATMVAVSERDSLSERVAREIPANPLKKRLAFLFYSGSAGGLAWVVLIMLITLLTMNFFPRALGLHQTGDLPDATVAILSFLGYCIGYGLLASYIRRLFFSSLVDIRNTWIIMFLVTAFCSVVPMFIWAVTGSDYELFLLGNPFIALSRDRSDAAQAFGMLLAAGAVFINLPWLKRQLNEFFKAGDQNG
ncbi:MAG TPA: hypothetical protein PLM07_10700 [Candidatus Rifleibacterium sp.]|nr:hypothetical protein [Candidatus Rifleibacterium sp.]HPT46360.1 hypothetical protein [Candidatus Rifleibacterium sp.]